ncbi:MAG: hypothetical protein ISR58_13915 [Anaerolineales bacterium]|nr:hypothetical protein [Chloroflexota bacterium]MBL6982274.1 hypothetical protein [Anaerolineales bacterium]
MSAISIILGGLILIVMLAVVGIVLANRQKDNPEERLENIVGDIDETQSRIDVIRLDSEGRQESRLPGDVTIDAPPPPPDVKH